MKYPDPQCWLKYDTLPKSNRLKSFSLYDEIKGVYKLDTENLYYDNLINK